MKQQVMRLSAILILVVLILAAVLPVMAAEKTEFTCIETVTSQEGGEFSFPNGNTHIRGRTLLADEWASDERLIGVNTIILNANLGKDGTGPMWGTFRIKNDEGGWEGTYAGHAGEWYNAVGKGYGAYEGLKLWWNKYYDECSGHILER